MQGNREIGFCGLINDTYICLIGAAIQHCLKEWRTGTTCEELVDFKYETVGDKYNPT